MALLHSTAFRLIIFTLLISVFIYVMILIFPGPWFHVRVWQILLFFATLTLLTSVLADKLLEKNELNSVAVILGAAVFRLLGSIVFVFVVLWEDYENILWFVVDFFIIYLLYLLFDIYSLITNLRLHSK